MNPHDLLDAIQCRNVSCSNYCGMKDALRSHH